MAYSRDLSKMAIMDYQGLSRTVKDYQGLSRTIKDYQVLSRTFKDCHGLSQTFILAIFYILISHGQTDRQTYIGTC